jgi:hypothetical protein
MVFLRGLISLIPFYLQAEHVHSANGVNLKKKKKKKKKVKRSAKQHRPWRPTAL